MRIPAACLLLSALLSTGAAANSLYQKLVEAAAPGPDALREARKQVREHRQTEILESLSVPPFHRRERRLPDERQPLCRTCHLPLPHRASVRTRSFMNMHSRYIDCATCHLRPEDIELEYAWLAGNGPRAGQRLAPPDAAADDGRKSLVPQPGARITAFYAGEPALPARQDAFAKTLGQTWEQEDEAGRAGLKARLHAPLEAQGPACRDCHGEQRPLLDLQALGASPERAHALQHNTIVRFFSRFREDDQRIRIRDGVPD